MSVPANPLPPKWPSALNLSNTSLSQPPPPPDSPSGSEDDDEFHHDDLDDVDDSEQQQQQEALRRQFFELAAANGGPTNEADASINQAQFKKLLKSHIAGTGATSDDPALESELDSMWSELPKMISGSGEGVTFHSLLTALSGGPSPDASPALSRRDSLSQGHGSGELNGSVDSSTAVWSSGHRKSASGGNATGKPIDAALRMMFAPRRGSIKSTGARAKRHSDSARAGLSPSSAMTDRQRANTLFPSHTVTPSVGLSPAQPNTNNSSFAVSPQAASSSGIVLNFGSPVAAGPTVSGALDLTDADWHDCSWLVQAHPAAFSSASPRNSFVASSPSSPSYVPVNPALAPATTLVSSSALQICMQHYLARWLNQHELNVIATMHKFVNPKKSGVAVQELLSYQVLQKVIAYLHVTLCSQPQATVIDPLPAFAQALGLLPPPTPVTAAFPMSTDELLHHLNIFSVLPLGTSQQLLAAFGPNVLHSTPLLQLLTDYKAVQIKHARLEKEYSLLTASRENLDSSHHDLSEQIPYLQQALESARHEKESMAKDIAKANELALQAAAAKSAHEKIQKKLQQLQEDHSALQSEMQVSKELQGSSDEDLNAAQAALAKAKEKLAQTETQLQELTARSTKKQTDDANTIRQQTEDHRALEHRYHDLLEKSQIFYRRLVAVGETAGLDSIEGIEDGTMLVGSLAINRAQKRDGAASHLKDELNDSLGAELDDFARVEALSRVEQQGMEIDKLKAQLAALSGRVTDKDREIERLHSEIDSLHAHATRGDKNGTGTVPLEIGPASDGDDKAHKNDGCCPAACTIM